MRNTSLEFVMSGAAHRGCLLFPVCPPEQRADLPRGGGSGGHPFDVSPFSSIPHAPTPSTSPRTQHMEVYVMVVNERSGPGGPFSHGVTWGGLPLSARRIATVATSFLLAAGVAGPA